MTDSKFVQWRTSNPVGYDELLRRRRKNYADDEEARRTQLAHNAAWRKKQKGRKTATKRTPHPKTFEINGQNVECWSIGRAADYLGVSKQTITNLETSDTIPTNHHICKSNRRWWPATFVEWVKPFFESRFPAEGSGISAQEFHRRVWIGWSEEQVRGVVPTVSTLKVTEDKDDQDSIEGAGQ